MKTLLSIFTLIVFSYGCSTIQVEQKVVDQQKLETLQSFSWAGIQGDEAMVRAKNPAVAQQVQRAVERELTKKGYNKVEPQSADFLVTWFGRVDQEVRAQSISHFYGSYGYGAVAGSRKVMVDQGAIQQTYTKGTLVLDVLDSNTKQVLWRGMGSDAIIKGMSDQQRGALINKAVKTILADFPRRP